MYQDKPADAGGVTAVDGAVRPQQVGFFDAADMHLRRDNSRINPARQRDSGSLAW